ncbi:hypothetical protein [Tunturiibacter psychrotolerans]|uniref:hypothetical protein n=1 Tax=Tunturiibacter psychrotolerans TaxID=3069686 RepID=UPI003D1D8FB7
MADDSNEPVEKLVDQFPEATGADLAYSISKAGLASIPVIGNLLGEVYGLFVASPVQENMKAFLITLAEVVDLLRANGVTKEDLQNNGFFRDAVTQAVKISATSRQESKRDMLRNALLNIALNPSADEDQIQLFLQMIETMTPTQIALLNYFRNPHKRLAEVFDSTRVAMGLPLDQGIYGVMPHLSSKPDLVKNLILDLYNRGLIPFSPKNNVLESTTITNTGIQFLNFVLTNPLEKA